MGHLLHQISRTPFGMDEDALDLFSFMKESNTISFNWNVVDFKKCTFIAPDSSHDFEVLVHIMSVPQTRTAAILMMLKSFDNVKSFKQTGAFVFFDNPVAEAFALALKLEARRHLSSIGVLCNNPAPEDLLRNDMHKYVPEDRWAKIFGQESHTNWYEVIC